MDETPPTPVPAAAEDPTTMEALGVIAGGIEKLLERIEGEDSSEKTRVDSMILLREILDTHGKLLKSTLSPENKLHPDVSSYNPDGERDHPRPPLRRPCFVLGVPVIAAQCTLDEIKELNKFTHSVDVPARQWRALLLHDSHHGEVLYISKPFRNFDDTREFSAAGGLLGICGIFHRDGVRPQNQEHAIARITELEATVERMQALLSSLPKPPATEVVLTGTP